MKSKVSKIDEDNLNLIRNNVAIFLRNCGIKYDKKGYLLDIAPQDHKGAQPFFKKAIVHTLDINQNSGATFIADICKNNKKIISDSSYDFVVCTEVLEHTLQPFNAVDEIRRILKKDGLFFASVPFNLRIHGPLPDCWRFTEHGIKELLKNYEIIRIDSIDDESRWLMPVHYTIIARKKISIIR
jgi:hypothetical protein